MGFTITHNVIIKQELPAVGIVCANPQRTKRLVAAYFEKKQILVDNWGIKIYKGTYNECHIFVGSVPMGAGGAGFAFLEMYNAGATHIIRFGSNDKNVNENNLKQIHLVAYADNLVGLMRDQGYPSHDWGKCIAATSSLNQHIFKVALAHNLQIQRVVCHHLEDYHAFNHPEALPDIQQKMVQSKIRQFDQSTEHACWDMETAALFLRAEQSNKQAASVLQSVQKTGSPLPYEGKGSAQVLAFELEIAKVLLETLSSV